MPEIEDDGDQGIAGTGKRPDFDLKKMKGIRFFWYECMCVVYLIRQRGV